MKKSELYGVIGSAAITGLIILLLFLLVMPGLQKPEDEGIMVSFGETDNGAGSNPTPVQETPAKTIPAPTPTPKTVKEDVMTQDDKSLAIAEQKKKERKEKEALERQQKEEKRKADEKKRREQEAIEKASAMNGLFGNQNSAGSGRTSGEGRQGNPAGSGNAGGHSWSLNGRSLNGTLVTPSYDNDVEGRITVNIRVDESGNVITATVGSPTTISDAATRNAAMSAAKRTRFSAGNGISTGTITYNFKLR